MNHPLFPKNILTFVVLVLGICHIQSCSSVRNYTSPLGPKFSGSFAKSRPVFDGTIKVVSFNIKFSRKIDHAIYELYEYDELKDADIILLQEMDAQGSELVAKALRYNFIYYPASVHGKHDRHFGNAVLSKWPMKDEMKVILPHEDVKKRQKRIAVAATIVVDTFEVRAYSVHTETIWLSQEKRLAQADSLIRSIAAGFEYVIVGGDFNTYNASSLEATESLFNDNGFTRASKGSGATERIGPFGMTLDHIFTKGMRILSVSKPQETRASDHLPISLELKIE